MFAGADQGARFLLVTFLCANKEKLPAVGQPPTSNTRAQPARQSPLSITLSRKGRGNHKTIPPITYKMRQGTELDATKRTPLKTLRLGTRKSQFDHRRCLVGSGSIMALLNGLGRKRDANWETRNP